ncbi:MAG TPA: MFS transporter [Nitrospiria bacterium]|nr:MFS transporter [Nitrospiria bacterium]
MSKKREAFFNRYLIRPGDINAFFGLMLDNVTQMILMAGILIGVFHYPKEIVYHRMIPGSVVGVLAGNLVFAWLAIRLARKSGRNDVTAMPLGIDTPSLFAFTFGIIGPAFLITHDAVLAWKISMSAIILAGLFKIAFSFAGDSIRNWVPRAGLLGPIAAIAIALIAFLPSLRIFNQPLVGFISLILILTTIVAHVKLPFNIPGAFAGVLAGIIIYYLLVLTGFYPHETGSQTNFWAPAFPFPSASFRDGLVPAFSYLPIVIPFVLMVLVGGIDVTESAAAGGDNYPASKILLTDGCATLLSGLCGGVVQTTPYIGQPAYKGMGAGAGYTIGTGLFIGLGGMIGYLGFFVNLIPEAAVAPILVFIGLEITAQSFLATPVKHYKAIAISFLPALATLVLILSNQFLGSAGLSGSHLKGDAGRTWQNLVVLSNGFIITSLIWASALTFLIERKFLKGAVFLFLGGILSLFGVIHSPYPDGRIFFPWHDHPEISLQLSAAYFLSGLFLIAMKGRASRAIIGK